MSIAMRMVTWTGFSLFFMWLGGYLAFINMAPANDDYDVAAAVVLTGSSGRIEEAVRLLERGNIDRLLISGVNIQVRARDLADIVGIRSEMLECCIELGRDALDTKGNAKEAADWAREHQYGQLIVITAEYHMPRTMLIFSKAMPEVELFPHSVSVKASLFGTVKEYNKYVLTLFGIRTGLV